MRTGRGRRVGAFNTAVARDEKRYRSILEKNEKKQEAQSAKRKGAAANRGRRTQTGK
jgi:hypothetical protein